VAEVGSAHTYLVFFTSTDKTKAPTRSWAQGPHMDKSITAFDHFQATREISKDRQTDKPLSAHRP